MNGNPAHDCTPATPPPPPKTFCELHPTDPTCLTPSNFTFLPNPTTTPTTVATAVLGETINRTPIQAPTVPTAPTAPTAVQGVTLTAPTGATPVTALPFTGPPNVGLLAGLGFSTLMLGAGLVLASRRRPASVGA